MKLLAAKLKVYLVLEEGLQCTDGHTDSLPLQALSRLLCALLDPGARLLRLQALPWLGQ